MSDCWGENGLMQMVDAGGERCFLPGLAGGRRIEAAAVWGALVIRNKLKYEASQAVNLSLIYVTIPLNF